MRKELVGKTALVTGGAGGLGLAIIKALAALGAEVSYTLRREESRAPALAALGATQAKALLCDITQRPRLREVMAQGFDIVINNAAVVEPIGRITDIRPEDFARAIEINLTAQFDIVQLALPAMLKKGGGTIVNISSGAAHAPKEGWAAYCISKAGLAMLTQSIHHEYGAQGIRSFGIAPGVVDTEMQAKIRASGINPVSRLPREALSPPAEPAQVIAWLCTAAADDLIGQELTVRDEALRHRAGLASA